jgi:hypothetical protein
LIHDSIIHAVERENADFLEELLKNRAFYGSLENDTKEDEFEKIIGDRDV